jgi:hypothetical protein
MELCRRLARGVVRTNKGMREKNKKDEVDERCSKDAKVEERSRPATRNENTSGKGKIKTNLPPS